MSVLSDIGTAAVFVVLAAIVLLFASIAIEAALQAANGIPKILKRLDEIEKRLP